MFSKKTKNEQELIKKIKSKSNGRLFIKSIRSDAAGTLRVVYYASYIEFCSETKLSVISESAYYDYWSPKWANIVAKSVMSYIKAHETKFSCVEIIIPIEQEMIMVRHVYTYKAKTNEYIGGRAT